MEQSVCICMIKQNKKWPIHLFSWSKFKIFSKKFHVRFIDQMAWNDVCFRDNHLLSLEYDLSAWISSKYFIILLLNYYGANIFKWKKKKNNFFFMLQQMWIFSKLMKLLKLLYPSIWSINVSRKAKKCFGSFK